MFNKKDYKTTMKVYPDLTSGQQNDGVRPPPSPPITVRTMNSDVKSMQESGGGPPKEEFLNPPRPPTIPEIPKPSNEDFKIKIPGYVGPEKGVFTSDSLPVIEDKSDTSEYAPPQKINFGRNPMKKIIGLIIIIVVSASIGAGLYFFVYPLLLGETDTPVASPATSPTPVVVTPTPSPSPSPMITHTTFINSDKVEEASSLTLADLELVAAGESLMKEVILKRNGSLVFLSDYFPVLIPEISIDEIKNAFEDDFTAFIYYDGNGSWPGYVFKRSDNVASIVAQNTIGKIETSNSLKNLFLKDPGTPAQEFKAGEYNGVSTRYLAYGNKGAALSYAWVNDRLLIATTFPALKALIDGKLAL